MLLDPHERARFIAWLDQNARSAEQLADQADKLPNNVGAIMAKQRRKESAAMRIVSDILKNTTSETLII